MNGILERIKIRGKNGVVPTFEQITETHRMVEEIVDNLDDGAILELLGGNSSDVAGLMDSMYQETFSTLYGDGGLVKESSLKYMSNLHNSMEETLRVEDLGYFLTSLFPNFDINWHHLEWCGLVKFKKLCVIAARDHGKSYFWSNIYPIWKMYRYKPQDFTSKNRPDLWTSERGTLICNDMGLGEELMDIMKNTIESNDILAERLVPDVKNNWAKTKIKTKNGVRFQAKSYGSRFRGRHPGWIVVDDFLDDSQIYSKDQREKAINYFQAVIMNALIKQGSIVVTGTPFHSNDLYGSLKKKENWRVFEYPSVYPDGKVLWPNKYDLGDLLEKRSDQGNLVFSREHLCRPIVSDSSIFPYTLLRRAFHQMENFCLVPNRDSFPIRFKYVVTGCDFAMSANVGADYSVFQTYGIDEQNTMWLIHFWRGKGKSFYEQISVLKSIQRNFNTDLMMLESNVFQQIFVDEADRQGLPVLGHHTGKGKNDLKKGLPGVALLFERNKIRFPRGDEYSRNVSDLICSELSSVAFTDKGLQGVGEHDDCPMSLWQAQLATREFGFGFAWA